LAVGDIPYNQASDTHQASRLTLQYFSLAPERATRLMLYMAPHNSDARQPEDTSTWPPAIITDLAYGAAALGVWGAKPFVERVREQTKDYYYGARGGDQEEDDGVGLGGPNTPTPAQSGARAASYASQIEGRGQSAGPAEQSSYSDMLDVVLALWKHSARKYQQQQQQESGASDSRNQDKVRTWLESIEEA